MTGCCPGPGPEAQSMSISSLPSYGPTPALLPQHYLQGHTLTQETVFFLLSIFKILRQDDSFQANKEAGLPQQAFSEGFAHSRQVDRPSGLGILFQLIHEGVTVKGELGHRPLRLTKGRWR